MNNERHIQSHLSAKTERAVGDRHDSEAEP